MAASAGATRRAGCIAWYLAWTRCAITDSPLGLSFWKKVCFIQRPRTGSSAQPATIPSRGLQRPRSAHAAVLGSGVGSLPSYLCGHFAPRRTNQSIPFLHPCSFPASCPEPLVMLVELCLALSVPASIRPVVGVGASPRRWSQIPGQWEAADGMGGELILLHRAEGKLPKLPPVWCRSGDLAKGLALPQLQERRWCWRQRNDQHCDPCLAKSWSSPVQLPILLPAIPWDVSCSCCSTRQIPAGLAFPVPTKRHS